MVTTRNMSTINRKILSLWAKEGLDLTQSSFSKLHSKESTLEEGREKYDLKPETFRKFVKHLMDKVVRMYASKEFTVSITNNNIVVNKNILKEYSTIERKDMIASRDSRWPSTSPTHATQLAQDKFTDSLIKASVIGSYIHDSLTEDAREQLEADSDFFTVEDEDAAKHYDGPSYFYCIARLVDPDNGHLVAGVKKQLRSLNVKDFNYDVKRMLAEFKNLTTRVTDLGGTLSNDDQLLNLWSACATMREKEFTRFVGELEDREAEKDPASRDSINDLIRKISAKQTRMETKNSWNAMSQEDIMLMSLVGMLESKKSKEKASKSTKSASAMVVTDAENQMIDASSTSNKTKRKEIPEWKKQPPAEGEPKEKMVNNRQYYWCAKCRAGQGMWAMHKEQEHQDDFKAIRRQMRETHSKTEGNGKKVTFNVTKDADTDDDNPNVQIKVKDELLNNAKAYLSQFTDFQEGGTQS